MGQLQVRRPFHAIKAFRCRTLAHPSSHMGHAAVAATYEIREAQMPSDAEWEEYKRSVTPLRRHPVERVILHKVTTFRRPKYSVLSPLFAAAMRREQMPNLVSRIYSLSGNGSLPISGGKFELRKRRR